MVYEVNDNRKGISALIGPEESNSSYTRELLGPALPVNEKRTYKAVSKLRNTPRT
jgi:hypothetical protein